jgi:3-hydroxyacyl-CoA dehydrogenase/enoyl-CoA hydratase/3-hydroxybutyryl-CoA epimerase
MHPTPQELSSGDSVQLQTLTYRRANNGVVFITIDVKDRPVNVLTPELHHEIGEVAEMLATDDKALGAVIHSGKASFMAGGDLNRIVRYYDMQRTAKEAYEQSRTYTESLRKLETCGKRVAVAINGTALGGGLELALACHYRVVADGPDIFLGLPEVSLGLLPGGGGTQRLPRLVGLKQAASLILTGKRLSPVEALQLGVVHGVAPHAELVSHAEQWVLQGGDAHQPWDRKGFRIPGGASLNDMNIGQLFQQLTASISAEYRHNYPAPIAALRCLFNGTTVSPWTPRSGSRPGVFCTDA